MLGIVPLILIKISDIKFTSLIEFELDCVPYIDVLLTGGGCVDSIEITATYICFLGNHFLQMFYLYVGQIPITTA